MIVVHHLNNSRSQRILWMLEEIGLKYEIRRYQRDATTRLAPPELKAVHPLGKSPVLEDGKIKLIESGAIIDYLAVRYGKRRFSPRPGSKEWAPYVQWMHYAEGSAMLPLMLALYVGRLGEAGAPLGPRIESEIANHLGFMDQSIAGKDWILGKKFSAADVQNSFVLEAAGARGRLEPYPHLTAWLGRMQARPAYQRALTRGGEYKIGT